MMCLLLLPLMQVETTITDVYSFMDATNTILDENMEEEPAKSPASSLPPSVKNTPRLSVVEASGQHAACWNA